MIPKNFKDLKSCSENDFKAEIIKVLSETFIIKEEWEGVHFSGAKMRIDAVMRPKDTTLWKNKKIVFGIEFKSPTKLESFNAQLHYVKQAIDYSHTKFDKLGYIPILVCPSFDFHEMYKNKETEKFIQHFAGQFNIGEIKQTHRGLSIVYSGDHFAWCEKDGVCEGKRWKFETTFGSKK